MTVLGLPWSTGAGWLLVQVTTPRTVFAATTMGVAPVPLPVNRNPPATRESTIPETFRRTRVRRNVFGAPVHYG
jgi:hypothetical protein